MAEWDDKALIDALNSGKQRAFEAVYDRFYEKLYVSCYGILKNTQEAEDVVVITFNKLFERHSVFQTLAQVQTWLFLAARNQCIDVLRRQRTQAEAGRNLREFNSLDTENEAFNDELDVLLLEKILTLVGELPPQSQQVIRLRYLEGLKYKEIADRMGISPRTAENLSRFALERLRRKLGHHKLVIFLVLLETCLS